MSEFIYESIHLAAKTFGVYDTTIGHAANGRKEKACDYHWEFLDKQPHKSYRKNPQQKRGKSVLCVETQQIFKTMSEAAVHFRICVSAISKALHGRGGKAAGFHWEFVKNTPPPKQVKNPPKTTAKSVCCVETQKVFKSLREAAEFFGIHSSGIGHALNGRKKTAGGYHWEFVTP